MGFVVLAFGDSGKRVGTCKRRCKGNRHGQLGEYILLLLAGDGFLNFGGGHGD